MGLQLNVLPWPDPVIDERGFPPRSAYFEWCWLPVIGPTAAVTYWRLIDLLEGRTGCLPSNPDGTTIIVAELATWVGLGQAQPSAQTLHRLVGRVAGFGLARLDGHTIAVRRKVPWLTHGQLSRLPNSLHVVHHNLLRLHGVEL